MVDNCYKSRVALQETAREVMTFFFGEQYFEDQSRSPGIRTTLQNSYAGHQFDS